MKKLSLFLSAIGGTIAGYIFTNKELQTDLKKSKNAEDMAKVFGKHIAKDAKKVKKNAEDFLQKPEVQNKIKQAKKFANEQFGKAKKEVQKLEVEGKKLVKKVQTKIDATTVKGAKKSITASKKVSTKAKKVVTKKTTKKSA